MTILRFRENEIEDSAVVDALKEIDNIIEELRASTSSALDISTVDVSLVYFLDD